MATTANNGSVAASVNSSSVPQITSPFLRLPAEIRNMVYAHVLGGYTWSVRMTQDAAGNTQVRADNSVKKALALLKVNRQIHTEARLFPYLYNTFAGVHNGHLHDWIKSLNHTGRACIKSIRQYQRGYLVYNPEDQGLTINPVFWMDIPRIANWGLDGLQRIEVEVALQKWGRASDKDQMKRTIDEALCKLHKLVEAKHPGVKVEVFMRRGY